jgi:hypothetical protein
MTSRVEQERRNRIRLAVAAYAYEFEDDVIMPDAEFDKLALAIQPLVLTGDDRHDLFFLTRFAPHTGQWVRFHPNIEGLRRIYRSIWLTGPAKFAK